MTSGLINMGLIAVLVVMLCCGTATAQSGSCTNAIISMSSCLNYITGNSSTPSSSCCSQLGNVVQSQPQCLCSVLNGGGAALGIAINQTLALALPGACNLQTPPVSQCNAAGGPTTSTAATPATSPAGPPSEDTPNSPTTPSDSDTPVGSGSGSKTVPSTNGSSSDGSNIKAAPLHLLAFVLFVLSCASTATRV